MSGIKRAFGNSDSEDDEPNNSFQSATKRQNRNKDELLTGFQSNNPISKSSSSTSKRTKDEPRIIKSRSNQNWMEERKRALGLADYARKNLGGLVTMSATNGGSVVPQPAANANGDGNGNDKVGNGDTLPMEQKRGLTIRKKEEERSLEEEEEELKRLMDQAASSSNLDQDRTPPRNQTSRTPEPEETEEELARKALLSGINPESSNAYDETRIIQQALTEEELLRSDLNYKPSEPTLEDYNRVPVEGFGMALLRGMGWKEGQNQNTLPEVKKRSNLLGLGAKDRLNLNEGGSGSKLGGVGNKGKDKAKVVRADDSRGYKPLIRRESDRLERGGASGSSSPAPIASFSSSRHQDNNGASSSSSLNQKITSREHRRDESSTQSRSKRDRSSSPRSDRKDRDRDYGRSRRDDDDRRSGKDRERESGRREGDRDREKDRERSRRKEDDRERRNGDDRDRDRERERDRRRDEDRDRERDRRKDKERSERR